MDRDNNNDDEFQFTDPENFSLEDVQHDENLDDHIDGDSMSGDDPTMSGHEDSYDYTMAQEGGFVEKYIVPYKKPIIIAVAALAVVIAGIVIIKMRSTSTPAKVIPSVKSTREPSPITPPATGAPDTSGLQNQITQNETAIADIDNKLTAINKNLTTLARSQSIIAANSNSIDSLNKAVISIQTKLKAKPKLAKFNPAVSYTVDSCWNGRAWLVGKQGHGQKYINVSIGYMIPDYGKVIHIFGGNTATSPCVVQTLNAKNKQQHNISYGVNDS